MADAAILRREMRRRKILENGEDRFRKLAAAERTLTKGAACAVNQTCKEAVNTRHGESEFSISEHQISCGGLNIDHITHNAVDEDDSDDDCYQESRHAEQPTQSSNIQTLPKILSENKPCSKVKSCEGTRTVSKSPNSSFLLDIAFRRKWLSTLLAVLGYVLVSIFGHTVLNKCIILFLSVQFGIACIEIISTAQQQLPQGILFKVLIFSGVECPIYCLSIYEAVIRVVEDIAVFLFTFFMCHWWMEAILRIIQVDTKV